MLCSISSTGKSGSSWLDRLRSNKGFPTGDNLDLDHFLNNNNNDVSNSNTDFDDKPLTNRKLTRTATTEIEISSSDKDKEWFGIMSNVLCELFNMGESEESASISGRKSLRKQTNPKFCVISNSSSTPAVAAVVNNNNVIMDEETKKKKKSFDSVSSVRKDENVQATTETETETETETKSEENNDVEEKEEVLFGYSRSEVTVIDTSFSVWKFDKLVFRRKNVWKVRDKKAKSKTLGRKKRKQTPFDTDTNTNTDANPNVVTFKKSKLLSTSHFDSQSPSTHLSQNPQDDKKEEVCKETPDDLSQVPDKRIPFTRSPRKSRKGDSSVILIKGISTSKNSGARIPKSGSKTVNGNTRPDMIHHYKVLN